MFVLMHLGNHMMAVGGVPTHQRWLDLLRLLYRHPLVETVLLCMLVVQLISGMGMAGGLLGRGRPGRVLGAVARWQAISGLLLGALVLVHVGAVLFGRMALELDTNFYFAAAGLHTPWAWFFAPYYWVGVTALGVHLACVAHRRLPARWGALRKLIPISLVAGGMALGALLVALMGGPLVQVDIPARYLATYGF
ncbi:MAG: hypothetical protein R3E56_07325 [Burkholderiaceae bacterium]